MRKWATLPIAALALVGAVLCARSANPGATGQAAPTIDAQTRNLAHDLVLAEINNGSAGNFALLESAIALPIANTLASGNPKLQAELTTKVHEALGPWRDDYTNTLIEAYAGNLTASRMRAMVEFLTGPGGRAEATNLPLLKRSLASAQVMEPDQIAKMEADSNVAYQQAPEARRNLIERILKAQNLEERTKQDFRKLYSTMNAAVANATSVEGADQEKSSNSKPLYENDEINKLVEADARRTMAVERSFYLTHYRDEELSLMATYLEGDAGQAIMARLPTIRREVGIAMAADRNRRLPNLTKSMCLATSCSTEQKDRLDHLMTVLQRGMQTALSQ